MRVAFIASPRAAHQHESAKKLAAGLALHGDLAEIYPSARATEVFAGKPDAMACWGWRNGRILRSRGFNVLVMERAYLADRFTWISLGWNGLNGRATWPACQDDGQRWARHFATLMQPWHIRDEGYALLLGQVPTDMACIQVDHERWLASTAAHLRAAGHEVRYRPHPQGLARVLGVPVAPGSLQDAFAGARFAVTWNSNSGVDAIMAGVPTVAMDPGSMAYEVTSHSLEAPIVTPDREGWGRSLAWRQWLPEELADGSAWSAVRDALN